MTPREQYDAFLRHVGIIHPGFNMSRSSLKPICEFLETKLKVDDIRPLKGDRVFSELHRRSPKDHQKYIPALHELIRVWSTSLAYQTTGFGTMHRRASFNQALHVGAENELSGTTIVLLNEISNAPMEIGYGQRIARTVGRSNVFNDHTGDFIPLAEFQVEGASGGHGAHSGPKGLIEVVGGPQQVNGNVIASECLGIFIDECLKIRTHRLDKEVTVGKLKYTLFRLERVVSRYNRVLKAKGGAYAAHQLVLCPAGGIWYLSVAEAILPKTQLNFEIPFLKLGNPGLGAHDFTEMFEETNSNSSSRGRGELFKRCRANAVATTTHLFNASGETAQQYLRSYFTLFSFVVAVKTHARCWAYRARRLNPNAVVSDHEQKNYYEILPKVELHELLHKHVLAQCPALAVQLSAPSTKQTLAARVLADVKDAFEYGFAFDKDLADEMNLDGTGHYTSYFDLTFGAYKGDVKITGTGKPLPASNYIARENDGRGKGFVLTVVFEMRSVSNAFNALGNLKRASPTGVNVLAIMNDLQSIPAH